MTGLGAAAGWTQAIAGLALLALLLFLLAIRYGHWGIWLAGYLCVVLALVLAIVAAPRTAAQGSGPAAPTVVSQPSVGSGVLPSVDRTGHGVTTATAAVEAI